jgi:hypothetical protein
VAKIWTEPLDWTRHLNRMPDGLPVEGENLYWRAKTLEPHDVIFVRVAGFTFEFHSIKQVETCLKFYSEKIHPTSRLLLDGGGHWEYQRWFERLPIYLQEEPKRKKVVTALEKALRQVTSAKK